LRSLGSSSVEDTLAERCRLPPPPSQPHTEGRRLAASLEGTRLRPPEMGASAPSSEGTLPGARALGDTHRRGLSASTAACDARAATLLRPSDGERCARPALGWPRPRRLGGVRRGRPGACRRRNKGAGTRARQRWPIASAHRSVGRGFQQLSAPASCLWFSCPPKRRTFRAYAIELRNLGIPRVNLCKRRPRSGDHK
jgi:hypothetical protein